TDSYPLTIEYGIVNGDSGDWNLSNFGLPKSGSRIDNDLHIINQTLKNKGRIVINKPVKNLLLNKISDKNIPLKFALHQNYPNPFNSYTTIKYDLPIKTNVKILIYDILGRKVKTLIDKTEDAGYKTIVWDGRSDAGITVASGLYFYRIEMKGFIKTRKLLLVK
ncbi:MAG: T9SS type A sorting domain-containing protein, partial [Calditrichia bacterium]